MVVNHNFIYSFLTGVAEVCNVLRSKLAQVAYVPATNVTQLHAFVFKEFCEQTFYFYL